MNEIAFVLHNFPPSSYKHQRVLWISMSFYSHFTIICLFIVPFLCSQKSSNLLITLSLSKYRGISWYFITAWNPFSFNNFFLKEVFILPLSFYSWFVPDSYVVYFSLKFPVVSFESKATNSHQRKLNFCWHPDVI